MSEFKAGPLLSKIQNPEDLRTKISPEELTQLCQELRNFIIDVVSEKGGHFSASLGVVEMTVAIHYVFNTPYDQLIWDVGHQAYGHKVLTGRKDIFHSNRKHGGVSGFPKRSESEYDSFGVGHSSTSISAALGMAIANRLNGTDQQHIAVIGDGAMTAGMAFEGLNHGGVEDTNLLVILNDNCMSIDPNVGALKEYLTKVSSQIKEPKIAEVNDSPEEDHAASTLMDPSNLFEALNFSYFGPIDGHDVNQLVDVLSQLKNTPGPKLLHCVTTKGKGYQPAEAGSPTEWHAPGLFNKETGEIIRSRSTDQKPPKFQDVFGHTIVELAEQNENIVGVTPAMPTGCSLTHMMETLPDRAFDVGIAEQHAVTFSAGLATQGKVPFCNIYSTFMQRAYDQVIHDVALQNLNVVFCLDRAGLAGADGSTHHGAFDLAYMRCIPNLIVSSPMNESELRNLMYSAQLKNAGSWVIRYPRGRGVLTEWKTPLSEIKPGKGRKIRSGTDVALLSIGPIGNKGIEAAKVLEKEGISLAHYDMRFVKPIDENLLHEVFKSFKQIVTIEDGCLKGGMGSAVLEFMADKGYQAQVVRLGIHDQFIEHGTQEELYSDCKYNTEDIIAEVRKMAIDKNKMVS